MDWFKIVKEVSQGFMVLPCLFNFYAEFIMEMPGWMKHKLESRLLGEISIILRYANDNTLIAESKEELKNLWWRWKGKVKKLA